MAYEELLIAEGSDWCWWYGPEHESANRPEFDQLYRSHLANVYRFLNLAPPEELSRPILHIATPDVRVPPTGADTPHHRWRGDVVLRVAGRRQLQGGRTLGLDAREEVPGARGPVRQRRRELVPARGLPLRDGTPTARHGSADHAAIPGWRSAAARDDSSGRRRRCQRRPRPMCLYPHSGGRAFPWLAPASPKAAACVFSSRYGTRDSRWMPSRSRAGWR